MNKYKVEIKSEFCNETLEIDSYGPMDAATLAASKFQEYVLVQSKVKVTSESTGVVKYFCTRPSFTVHASTKEDFND